MITQARETFLPPEYPSNEENDEKSYFTSAVQADSIVGTALYSAKLLPVAGFYPKAT